MRKQRQEAHQYGQRFNNLQDFLLLAGIITQATANSVVAESAIDLAKWNGAAENVPK